MSRIKKILQKYFRKKIEEINFGPNVHIGKYTYGINESTICSAPTINQPKIKIGNFCSIAPGVMILANVDHPTNLPSTFPFKTLLYRKYVGKKVPELNNFDSITKGDINIGHDVWIGQNSIILSGVSIGTGVIIGAGSVVAKNIPPYAIAVGNPAKVIKFRFPIPLIEKLLNSQWWNLNLEDLEDLEEFFYSSDIEKFVERISFNKRL